MAQEDEDRARRMAAFKALVEAQDARATVARSRGEVAERFGLTEAEVLVVEREGIEGQWPPLG